MVKTIKTDPQRARALGRVYVFNQPPGAYDNDKRRGHERRLNLVELALGDLTTSQLAMLDTLLAALRRDDVRGLAYAVDITRGELAAHMGKPATVGFDHDRLDALAALQVVEGQGLIEAWKAIKPGGGKEWVYGIQSNWIMPLVERRAPDVLQAFEARYAERQAELEAQAAAEAEVERQRLAEAAAAAAAEAERQRQAEIVRQNQKRLAEAKAAEEHDKWIAAMSPAELLEYNRRGHDYVTGRYVYVWDYRAQKHVRRARRWHGLTFRQGVALVVLVLANVSMWSVVLALLIRT